MIVNRYTDRCYSFLLDASRYRVGCNKSDHRGKFPLYQPAYALDLKRQGIDRCATLFDTIKSQLRALTVMLQRISEYEDLYGDSTILQDLLCKTYVEIFRFWSRIDRECDQYGKWYTKPCRYVY